MKLEGGKDYSFLLQAPGQLETLFQSYKVTMKHPVLRLPTAAQVVQTLALPIVRPPVEIWKAHCNHCGSEVPLAVMLNREHWQKSAKRTPWKLKR